MTPAHALLAALGLARPAGRWVPGARDRAGARDRHRPLRRRSAACATGGCDSADASFAALRVHDLRVGARRGQHRARRARCERAGAPRVAASSRPPRSASWCPTQVDASRARSARSSCRAAIVGMPPRGTAVDALDGRRAAAPCARRRGRRSRCSSAASRATTSLPADGHPARGRRATRAATSGRRSSPRVLPRRRAPAPTSAAEGTLRGRLRVAADRPALAGRARARQRARRASRARRRRDGGARPRCERALRGRCPASASRSPRSTEEPAHRFLYRDAEGDQQFLDIFAVLILAGASVRRVQPREPRRRGPAPRDRHRDGARRRRRRARDPPAAARRPGRACSASRSASRASGSRRALQAGVLDGPCSRCR